MAMTYREWLEGNKLRYEEYLAGLAEEARRANEREALNLGEKTTIIEAVTVIAAALAHYQMTEDADMWCVLDGTRVAQVQENDTLLRLFKVAMEHEKGHAR